MRRLKTIFFWVFVFSAVGAGVFAYVHLKNSKKPQVNALSVLPDSCLVYVNTADLFELNKKVNSQSLIADKLNLFYEVADLLSTIQQFDSIFYSNEPLREELSSNQIHLAYYQSGCLIAFNLKQLGETEKIQSYLTELFHAEKIGNTVFRFKLSAKHSFYFQITDGVVLLSNTEALIVSANKPNLPKLEKNKVFQHFKHGLSDTKLVSVYVDHHLYEKSSASKKLNLNLVCKKGVSAGTIEFKPSQIIVNGFLRVDSGEILSDLRTQESQSSKVLSTYLPINTVAFKAFGFSNYAEFKKPLPQQETEAEFWDLMNQKALYNIRSDFENNIGSHLLEYSTTGSDEAILALEIADTLNAREQLRELSDSLFYDDSLQIYRIVNDEANQGLCLFEPLSYAQTKFAAIFLSHIYFSETKEQLIQNLNYLKQERFLSQQASFMAYMNDHFPDEYNYLAYNSPNQNKKEIASFFNFTQSKDSDPFQNFKHFLYCVSRQGEDLKFRMQLLHESENKTPDQNTLWTLRLDTNAAIQAQGFVNHITNENELLIQDESNTLYLINAKGTILWKKKLAEKILSKIYTVDIYKNGKFQMLFNTLNGIHLIDRNGRYVENYPVELASEASAEISLFDYDANKDYRILIPCKNNIIYNYNIHGEKQEKFNVVKTEQAVKLPVQYVKIGLSDYLVAVDVEGKIYTFSRKGIGRIGLRNRAVVNCKAFYCDLSNSINSSYLVYVDDINGHINKISFDDRKEIVKLNSETENADVKFNLIDDNRSMDLMLTKNSSIWSYNFSGNLISELTAGTRLSKSDFFKDESHAFYVSLSEDRETVILNDVLNQKIQVLQGDGLPYISNLFKDHKYYLILSKAKQLSCVRVN